MKQSETYYQDNIAKYTDEIQAVNKKLSRLSIIRLVVFLITAAAVYFLWGEWKWLILAVVLGLGILLKLVARYADIKERKKFLEAVLALNEKEISIANGVFQNEPTGEEFKDPKHFFSLDIDLFGLGSFFQFMNRTSLREGTLKLVSLLTANNIEGITEKQETIQELADKPDFRQRYTAAASLIEIETPIQQIEDWIKNYQPFTKSYFKAISIGFGVISSTLAILAMLDVLPSSYVGYWMFFGLLIVGRFVKKVNELSEKTDKAKEVFRQYAHLLAYIENETFQTSVLKAQQKKIGSETKKASELFKEFSKALDSLDNRSNLVGALAGNGFFLMDLKNSRRIEEWITENKEKVHHWFEVIAWFDAYNSLGNFSFNHADYVYPQLVSSGGCIQAEELGHPLLKTEKRVDNSIDMDEQQFFIITGANMAGKSTFLRTVSLHIVMANVGLPVCAKSSKYKPIKLITSMRTSDSLTDDSSYFFAELTRLKYIVDALQTDTYFIILDEILKGTNSTDKAIGSKKFVEKLVASHATGIIATHDLSLCEMEQNLQEVKNYYFDAEIIDDELHFDYRFKKGICQNMNASFLLKKMQIV
ncbi:MutS domain V [Pustulibacterium marinum]|uniref:MutS domain V n=1 Tax=Pustulibacterium marinum TaxID=1224947 RepID=A0A1I7HC65_9FLAO|nr:DNA mismatch repair protein MutS [Pustulibacterium marinum]SFU58297.1 MutS domain V [Pustulibacterium marinum]